MEVCIKKGYMQLEIITRNEWQDFKEELVKVVTQEVNKKLSQDRSKCLTTKEVCQHLNITPKTLQTYRDKYIISFTQVGSKIFFTLDDINDFLNNYKIKSKFPCGGKGGYA